MKFDITRDQHDNRVLRGEFPFTGYFLLRREGFRPVVSLERPQFDYFKKFTRSLGIVGTLITISDIIAVGVGFTFGIFGLIMLALSGIGEITSVIELKEHQVVHADVAEAEATATEPKVGE